MIFSSSLRSRLRPSVLAVSVIVAGLGLSLPALAQNNAPNPPSGTPVVTPAAVMPHIPAVVTPAGTPNIGGPVPAAAGTPSLTIPPPAAASESSRKKKKHQSDDEIDSKYAPMTQMDVVTSISDGRSHVAILLPLSGKNAALGQAMLNAAEMAVFDMGDSNFELMPRDTGPSSETATLAVRDAIASGAQLLLGPLFAGDVASAKPEVQSSSVNMLSLSTDVTLAEPGVYIMGFLPQAQVERVIGYAKEHGVSKLALLAPDNAYGHLVEQAFAGAALRENATVITTKTYAGRDNINQAVEELSAVKGQIQGLLIAAGGAELEQITAALDLNGFNGPKTKRKIHMLGTGLWDDATVAQNPMLTGGWYAASDPDLRQAFIESYNQLYDQDPPRLATLAYDATALAVALARRGHGFDRTALSNSNGFAGLDGIFRLTPKGTAERGLAVIEVGNSKNPNHVVDPSPTSFVGM